jgi:hypothetical protein
MSEATDDNTGDTGDATAPRVDEQWVRERLNQLWPTHTLALAELLVAMR